jgi:hypothetical protein
VLNIQPKRLYNGSRIVDGGRTATLSGAARGGTKQAVTTKQVALQPSPRNREGSRMRLAVVMKAIPSTRPAGRLCGERGCVGDARTNMIP